MPPIHYPGYKYLGPGTPLEQNLKDGVEPINDLDAAAKAHDIAYADPHKSTQEADREFLENTKHIDTVAGTIARAAISAKHYIDRATGSSTDLLFRPGLNKRPAETPTEEKAAKIPKTISERLNNDFPVLAPETVQEGKPDNVMSNIEERSVSGMDTGEGSIAQGQNAQHTGGTTSGVPRMGEPMQPMCTREKRVYKRSYIHYIKPLASKVKSKLENVANSFMKFQHITDCRELPYWSADASRTCLRSTC